MDRPAPGKGCSPGISRPGPACMGITWMDRAELSQTIPPPLRQMDQDPDDGRAGPAGHRVARAYGPRWVKIQAQVLERDGFICRLEYPGCTRTMPAISIPTSQRHFGRTDDPANSRASCPTCNPRPGPGAPTGSGGLRVVIERTAADITCARMCVQQTWPRREALDDPPIPTAPGRWKPWNVGAPWWR